MGGLTIWSGLDAQNLNSSYETYATSPGATRGEAKAMYDDVVSAETRTNIFIGVTAGLAATAVVLAIFTDWGGSEDSPTPTMSFGPDGAVIGATGSF